MPRRNAVECHATSRNHHIMVQNMMKFAKKRNTSLEQLAKQIGMSKSYIYAFARGDKGISLDTMERIAIGLAVTVTDLLKK